MSDITTLIDRLEKALDVIISGKTTLHVPPRETDVDVVVSDAIQFLKAQSVPGFVLVPVESAKFCAEKTKAMAATVEQKWGGYGKDLQSWQPHINALLDAVEQEKKNG